MESSRRPAKPCGPQDRRLRISRCACCRRARTGCDGKRPCIRCKSRGLRCVEAEQSRSRHAVILASYKVPTSHDSGPVVTEARPSSPNDILQAFFSLVGDNTSPFAKAFDRRLIETRLAASEPIRAAVQAIANVARAPAHDSDEIAAWRLNDIKSERPKLNRHLESLLPKPDQMMGQTALLFICLFAMYELLMDATGSGFVAVVKRTSLYLRTYPPSNLETLFPNRYLTLIYEMFELVTCLILDEDTYLADAALARNTCPEHTGYSGEEDADFNLLRLYCTFLAALTRVNARAVQWETDAREVVSSIDQPPSKEQCEVALAANGLLDSGLNILAAGKAASTIHSSITTGGQPQQGGANPLDFSSLQPVLQTYGLIRLARLFKEPLWHLVYDYPPAVEHIPNLENLASAALGILDRRLPYVGFESIFFLHFLPRMALEVNRTEDRDRIVSIMRCILTKGFAITAAYISDVEMTWQFGDQLRQSREGGYG